MADLWSGIKKVLAGIAPVLGNAIVPGVGGLAGTLLAGVLGVDSNDPDALNTALINATPDQIAKIKEIELTHRDEFERLFLQDRQDARQREIKIVQATGKKDLNLYVLAWVVVIGFFVLCGTLMYQTIPSGQNSIILMLFGGLQSGFATVLGYFFGSSKSSADKTQLLAQAQPIQTLPDKGTESRRVSE